ncbi:MAG: DUF91 domain-containing protein [Candidatus Aminicenantes bacterium]|nr:DUF91 domain-containing protein [Candidatus Aminicenantes bacterium]
MAEDIRIWEIIDGKSLNEIKKSKLNLESRLEEWIKEDISIVSHDLLIIGNQIETEFGGVVDLLCLDSIGDVVIIELKRDKTPRDITAQVLDYASWVKDLSNERITEIANEYLGEKGPLENAFNANFGEEIPEILNESHKMFVVASDIDSNTERIINYLSDTYGVGINAISFQYFKDENENEYLARAFLIEPSEVDRKRSSKRKPPLTFEQFKDVSDEKGVGELFDSIVKELTDLFDYRGTTRSTVSWLGKMGKSMNTILNILPNDSNKNEGLRFYVYIERLSKYLNTEIENLTDYLPANVEESRTWNVDTPAIFGYFKTLDEIKKFSEGLKSLRK